MGVESVSTHTVMNDATTTIVSRTTTIVSEHEEVFPDHRHGHRGDHHQHHLHNHNIVKDVRKTLRDYWFPKRSEDDNDDDEEEEVEEEVEEEEARHPLLLKPNNVMRRAYDYWKSLTKDSEESARELVSKAKHERDEAAKEAKWAVLGYKRVAREKFEAAEKKYRDALAAAETAHGQALERAKNRWLQQAEKVQKEVGAEAEGGITHKKWDRFKAAVDSLIFNPPKYACSPSSIYWFKLHEPAEIDSGWDCHEIWEHPYWHDHGHKSLKTVSKKRLPLGKVHEMMENLFHQAETKAKTAPSATSFDSTLKSVKEYYQGVLSRVARNEQGAIEELDEMADRVKAKLNEAKYHEEQTDSWLTAQWNAIVDNAGDTKDQYERVFKKAIMNVKQARNDAYNALLGNLQKAVQTARNNIKETIRQTKDEVDKSRVHRAIQEASQAFTDTLKEAENKIKTAPRNAYEDAVESFNRETSQLKHKLEAAAKSARKSGASVSYHASKSVSSAAHQASQSGKSMRNDASRKLDEARHSADSIRDRATKSASSIWGAATPFASTPLQNVHDKYHQMLGDAKHNLFGQHLSSHHRHDHVHHNHHYDHPTSIYGLITALYLLLLARKIWLRRSSWWSTSFGGSSLPSTSADTHGNLHVTKHGRHHRRHSNGSVSSDEDHHRHSHRRHSVSSIGSSHSHHRDHHEHQNHLEHHERHDSHEKHRRHESDSHRHHGGHHGVHADNAFSYVLHNFTAQVPATLILLVLLELGGFIRIGLHSLFTGLVISQLLQCGYFNNLMEQLGILDSALGERVSRRSARQMGRTLGWVVLGLAGAAYSIKVLHDES
ncbi:hypothetical protein BG011_006969 [Mortierella polycephala]|uniref:Uncharacterized protein n=1 Tax=Mortierella polycephala TaxID=41804 RepID=A0A9P6QDN5_9FUNG|nr:hypothetical protein BG011_006969 [Mortierella polycephala]